MQEHQQADTDDGSRADATVMTVALPDQAVLEGWDCISCCWKMTSMSSPYCCQTRSEDGCKPACMSCWAIRIEGAT